MSDAPFAKRRERYSVVTPTIITDRSGLAFRAISKFRSVMMRRTYLVHPTHDLKRCSERACRDRAVRFSALGLPARKRGPFRHHRAKHRKAYLQRRDATPRSWRSSHQRFRLPDCRSRAVLLEPVHLFRQKLGRDCSAAFSSPCKDQSARPSSVPQYSCAFCDSRRM